ncbi:MAG: hypothetical protein JWN45_758 [Acidobacteriaceae bacterium]|nr:hypothetical protein [Acidobacteriaceae bacterium]
MKIVPSGDFAVIASENIKFIVTRQGMPSLGYRTSEESAKMTAGDCGKDGGGIALENAPRLPFSRSLDGSGPSI